MVRTKPHFRASTGCRVASRTTPLLLFCSALMRFCLALCHHSDPLLQPGRPDIFREWGLQIIARSAVELSEQQVRCILSVRPAAVQT